jgi:hypothetical protein
MNRRIASIAAAVLLAACSAQLRDGTYGCAGTRVCPAVLNCWSDQICHRGLEPPDNDAGTDASTPPPDMGIVMMDGGSGSMCTPACTGAQMCVIGQWTNPPDMPSMGCASSPAPSHHGMACVMGPGSGCVTPDVCLPGPASNPACMRPCDPHVATCGFGEDCFMASTPVCALPCPTACPAPMMCLHGHCLPAGW